MDKKRDMSNQKALDSRISSLISELTCDDVIKCQKARKDLISIGKESITPLIKALNHPKEQVRWEAAK